MMYIASARSAVSWLTFGFVALLPGYLRAQGTSIQVPSTTPLSVQLLRHVPMRTGTSLEGRLLYPVYVDNQIAIPAGSLVRGEVVQLESDRSRRLHARLRGDFTPFHTPVVQFQQLALPDGTFQQISSEPVKDGIPILRLSPPPGKSRGSFIKRQLAQEKQRLKDFAALFTAPGRGDRLVQFVYTQLPYHPERIDAATSWTVELTQPVNLNLKSLSRSDPADPISRESGEHQTKAASEVMASRDQKTEWRLRAYLQQTISSATKKEETVFRRLCRSRSSMQITL